MTYEFRLQMAVDETDADDLAFWERIAKEDAVEYTVTLRLTAQESADDLQQYLDAVDKEDVSVAVYGVDSDQRKYMESIDPANVSVTYEDRFIEDIHADESRLIAEGFDINYFRFSGNGSGSSIKTAADDFTFDAGLQVAHDGMGDYVANVTYDDPVDVAFEESSGGAPTLGFELGGVDVQVSPNSVEATEEQDVGQPDDAEEWEQRILENLHAAEEY